MTRDDASHSTHAEVAALTDHELAPLMRLVVRLRFVGVPILATLATLYAIYEPTLWKVLLPSSFAAFLLATVAHDVRSGVGRVFDAGRLLYLVSTVLAAQAIAILLTGGIFSPLILLLPAMHLMAALLLGRGRLILTLALAILGLVWAFAAGYLAGPLRELVPPVLLGADGTPPDASWVILVAIGMTLIVTVTSLAAIYVRGAFTRAAYAAATARADLIQAARARNRELVSLSGAIAHELKNPLAAIRGLAGVLAKRLPDKSRDAEQMGVLIGEVKRMAGILDEMLNLARPVEGLAVREVAADQLAGSVVAQHQGVAAEAGVILTLEATTERRIHADPRKLEQVLANLVQNAIDAAQTRVALSARADAGGGVAFEVTDDGPGLAAEVKDRLFEPGATSKPGGTGLGLTIARAIVEQHGGALTLQDRDEGGCVARILLPRAAEADHG